MLFPVPRFPSLSFSLLYAGCLHNKRTFEVHALQIKVAELRERCDVVRDGASEFVAAEVEYHERRRERFENPQRLVERRPWERGTCEKSSIRFRRVAWALRST